MAYYPTPRNEDEIFNPNNFPTSNPLSNLGEFALLYPNAQGAITFTETVAGTLNVLEIGAGGIEYNGTNVSFTKIAAIQALSSASNPTTLNINKTLQIQNGETTAPPTSFISLDTSGNLMRMNLCADGTTNNYGSATQVLTSGGAGGSLSWQNAGAGGSQNLNQVLTTGNTTTQTAIFQNVGAGASMTVAGGGLGLASTGLANSITSGTSILTNTTSNRVIDLDVTLANPHLRITQNTANNHYCTLDHDSLLFKPAGAVNPVTGIQANTTTNGLQLNTGGVLTLDGLGGSDGQFLKRNSAGNAVWDTVSTNPTLTNVLTNGNTTTLNAIFNNATAGTPTTTVVNTGVSIAVGPAVNTITQVGMSVIAGLEQSAYEADGMEYTLSSAGLPVGKTIIDDKVTIQTIAGGLVTTSNTIEAGLTTMLNGTNTLTTSATTLVIADTSSAPAIITNTVEDNKLTITNTTGIQKTILLDNSTVSPYIGLQNNDNSPTLLQAIFDIDSLLFYTGTNPLALSAIGIERSGSGLQLTTNGTLSFNGLGGSNGDILVYSGGNAFWQAPPAVSTVQSGIISNPVYSATVATNQLFTTPYVGLNPPPVTLTVNTGTGSTSIVVAGIAGYSSTGSGASTNWTGFNWFISGAVPAGGTLNWIAD